MKILAIEFSSERRSVAVLDADRVHGQAAETIGRGTRAFALIEEALRQPRLEREQIECLVVGLGPGSYAGIRSAIALAQGWQVARNIHLLGLGSVEALAAQARKAGHFGQVHFLIDAQRNQFYSATYAIHPGSSHLESALRLITEPEAGALARQGLTIGGPDLVDRFPTLKVLLPDAAALGLLAVGRTDFVSGDTLQPIYLRETTFLKAPPPRVLPRT